MTARSSAGLILLLLVTLTAQLPRRAVARAAARSATVTRPARQLRAPGAQAAPEVTPLEPGKPVEREISGGQTQCYQISLPAGWFAGVTVQQRGVDVAEQVFAPDGKLIAEFDSEWRPQGAEGADFVADTAGVYRLDVKAKIKGAAGRYGLLVAEIRAATEQERSAQEAHRLSTASSIMFRAGKYKEAHALAERALAVGEKALGPGHVYVAYLLSELANVLREKGEYAEAEESLQRALSIDEKTLGPEHPQRVEALSRLGFVYQDKGDNAKAERMLQQALEITERTLGAEHPQVVSDLAGIGPFHVSLGDLERAERELRRALAVGEKTLEPYDPLMGRVLNNLAYLYLNKKEYDRGEAFAEQALAVYEKALGPEHPHLAFPLINLGRIARQRKEHARSLELYRRALAIREKALGPEHIVVAGLVNNIANIYKAEGEYAEALKMYQRALSIAERMAGPYQLATIVVLGNIANLYRVQGDVADAIKFQTRVDERLEKALALNLAIGSERQKLAYFHSLAERTDRTISLHVNLAPQDRAACALAALVLLQRKGRVQDAMSGSLAALRQRSDAEDQNLLDRLNSVTARLAKLALSGPENFGPDEYRPLLKALEEQKERLEAEISRRSAEFRAQSQPVTLAAVQGAVPRDAALIEFVAYRPFEPKAEINQYGEPRYVAYVIRNQGEVQWKELGDADAIDGAVSALRRALSDPQREDVRGLARAVDEQVMRPVRALAGGATHLLVSPDGELNLIPFEALVDERGHYLVESNAFTYLTSGRDLLRMQVARVSKSDPLVMADPAFGEPGATQTASAAAGPPAPGGRRRSVTAARWMSEVYFAPLGGTEQEAKTVKDLFPDAKLLTGAQATEAAVKRVAAPRMLHVARHGFFLQDAEADAAAHSQASGRGAGPESGNPLLRSGLALAGANLRGGAGDDGILTALEASGLNLWGTKLVVLSACDTGLGEVRNGEGVYGLRRAFVLAGAESLVMSLWPASDYSTRQLMTNYYRNLKRGLGRGEALRRAQLGLLGRGRRLHPFYWANFIQSGEWVGLDSRR